jgi:ADP-ribose pyrophosphatase YjhB (NUDIX family)
MDNKYSGAGVVIIQSYYNKNAFFIIREKNGIWSIPGGKRDKTDKTIYYTAHKELKEESRGLFSISPDVLKNCYSYDKNTGNSQFYKAYFMYVSPNTPITRKYYYNNKKIIDKNSLNFSHPYKETDKMDRIYVDTFIADLRNIQPDGTMITHKASNGESIILRERDVAIIKNNINILNSLQPYKLKFNKNNTINGINRFYTFYL